MTYKPAVSYPRVDGVPGMLDWEKPHIFGELAVDIWEQRNRYRAALERIANWTSGDTSTIVIARDVLRL